MESITSQEINKEIFSTIISDPANLQPLKNLNIENALQKFPFCQILHTLNCKISKENNSPEFEKLVLKAAIYAPNRKVLHADIHQVKFFNDFKQHNKIEPESELQEDIRTIGRSCSSVITNEFPGVTTYAENKEDLYTEIIEEKNTDQTSEQALHETFIPQKAVKNEPDKILPENIAAVDFIAFQKKNNDPINIHSSLLTENSLDEKTTPLQNVVSEAYDLAENRQISKYDDDQMPFTFLWWLHKTRIEHAASYQPYVDFKLDVDATIQKTTAEELDHQIKQNIFHIQSPLDELEKEGTLSTIHFDLKSKEDVLIEKFILEEPQIKPPAPEKLDNENKARKSAEYQNDLVSETLASIYSEQMLFHKAIDTYKKLSLKLPEKRAYFADQIRKLESRLNK